MRLLVVFVLFLTSISFSEELTFPIEVQSGYLYNFTCFTANKVLKVTDKEKMLKGKKFTPDNKPFLERKAKDGHVFFTLFFVLDKASSLSIYDYKLLVKEKEYSCIGLYHYPKSFQKNNHPLYYSQKVNNKLYDIRDWCVKTELEKTWVELLYEIPAQKDDVQLVPALPTSPEQPGYNIKVYYPEYEKDIIGKSFSSTSNKILCYRFPGYNNYSNDGLLAKRLKGTVTYDYSDVIKSHTYFFSSDGNQIEIISNSFGVNRVIVRIFSVYNQTPHVLNAAIDAFDLNVNKKAHIIMEDYLKYKEDPDSYHFEEKDFSIDFSLVQNTKWEHLKMEISRKTAN